MGFEFVTATRILFGAGTLNEAGAAVAALGRRALVVIGSGSAAVQALASMLAANGVEWQGFAVSGEPTLEVIIAGRQAALDAGCDVVIGFGGGSVLDAAKAVAILATNPGDVFDYLEVVGRNQPLRQAGIPFVAFPTTAGTGSEVTRNAVITVVERGVKVSLRSPLMLARLAVVDPELTRSLPPPVTASTGMDALAQVIEPFVSRRANPMTDLFCQDGIRSAAGALRQAYHHGDDLEARRGMAWASLLGGLSLANAALGAVHGFAGPIGGMFPAPHGAVCAALLPHVFRVNVQALRERQPQHPALERYRQVACWLTGAVQASTEEGAAWLETLCRDLCIPGLAQYGITTGDLALLVERGRQASSMKGNPIDLTEAELLAILERSL